MTRKKRPAPQPMVSIICRTVNRPTLKQAITSVGKQDWPSIELVLVDAAGKGLEDIESPATHVHLSIVSSGKALNRPQAANAGLDTARGDYLLFLDDDDWISPKHISKLMNHALRYPDKQVVYSKTRKASADGKLLDEIIAVPFDRTVLRRDNFIPIHAALFSAALVRAGCRFDKNLAVYEDWDFWLQCAEHTDFKQATHIGAYYRVGGDSATMLDEHEQRYQPGHPMADARARLLHKWRRKWTGEQWNALLGLIDQTSQLQTMHSDLEYAHGAIRERDEQISSLSNQSEQLTTTLSKVQDDHHQLQDAFHQLQDAFHQLQTNHLELNLAHEALDRGIKEILDSFSWRVTAPYRWIARRTVNLLRSRQRPDPDIASAPKEPAAGPLVGEILAPASDDTSCNDKLTLQAWAWSPDALSKISIFADDLLLCNVNPIPQFNNIEDAKRIGFAKLINLETLHTGRKQIRLEITDAENRTISISRNIVYRDPAATYRQWLASNKSLDEDIQTPDNTDSGSISVQFNLIVHISASNSDSAILNTLTDIEQQDISNWHCYIVTPDTELKRVSALIRNSFADCPRFSSISDIHKIPCNDEALYSFLCAGERLRKNCLGMVANAWSADTTLLYSDHDEISKDGKYLKPWFTFSWSPDLLLSSNYIGGVYFVKGAFIKGELFTPDVVASLTSSDSSTAWRYRMLLKLTASLPSSSVHRLAKMLWSKPEPGDDEKEKLLSDELDAVRDVLTQNHQMPDAEVTTEHGIRHVRWPLKTQPGVSVIIPTTGNMRFLKPCLDTLASTDYPNLEIVILDNSRGAHSHGIQYARNAGAKVIECNEPFNWSRLNNQGVKQSTGDILLFLNDDIEVLHPNWLSEMVRQAVRDDVGTVGCMLLYPNGAIQHAGVFLVDHGGGARHLFHKQLPGDGIYQSLDRCVREVSASTGACLMIRRDRFEQLGGFDEDLSIVGNDIDLCLRALESGLRNVWTPHSRLIHLESVSRKSKPIGNDEKSMWKRWEHRFMAGDPYYNPALSLLREDCTIAERSRAHAAGSSETFAGTGTHGVNLVAYIRASMGVGEAARGNAAALEASGVPFGIINYERGNPSKMDNLRWQHREMPDPAYDINLLHINADHLPSVIADLGAEKFRNRYNIGFWAWELPEFPDRWLDSFDHLDEVWVPSTFVNQAIAAKSPVPVVTIPHIVNIDLAGAQRYQRSDFGISPGAFVFVTMFDIHSIAQRKNPYGAIRAFKKAFSADDKFVQLAIKINNADQATVNVLNEHIGDYQNILLIDQHLDRAGIDSLINCIDCYVSLHHSEGFGLGPAEAMSLGKPAILTNWSGNTEYMRHDNCMPVDYQLKTLGRDYGPYEAHQYWAIPDINHAAAHMRTLANNPALAKTIGERGRLTIESEFSAQAIGTRMKKRLESIARIKAKARGQTDTTK